MQDNEALNPDYMKGFNEGYLFTEAFPDIAKQIAKTPGLSSRGTGFTAGREQFIADKERTLLPSWLRSDIEPDRNFGDDRHTEMDEPEPER